MFVSTLIHTDDGGIVRNLNFSGGIIIILKRKMLQRVVKNRLLLENSMLCHIFF